MTEAYTAYRKRNKRNRRVSILDGHPRLSFFVRQQHRIFKRKMANQGLLFIPDISGFTRFVSQTEIEHSRLIIQELLELLINANEIGLEVSEVEGDAILFYKFGESPDLPALYRQVEKMFCEFHKHLLAYEHRRFCYCDACQGAIQLTLKVITHYGEFTSYNVKNFSKLIGKDVIVAHQLLKNDIDQHEYWLVTDNLAPENPPAELKQWMHWSSSTKQTETGVIPFHYTALSQLKNEIPPDPSLHLELSQKAKVFSLTEIYNTDIITLFHATGDFNFRSKWQEGVRTVEEVGHYLPRVGMRCRCVMENGEATIYSSSYSYSPQRITFSETDEQKKHASYYTLEKIDDHTTRLTLDFYLKKNPVQQLLLRFSGKSKLEARFRRSLKNLHAVVKEIQLS